MAEVDGGDERSTERLIVVDESLANRTATELKRRGRAATTVAEAGLRRSLDPELLVGLSDQLADVPWVLLTGDDAMPLEHAEVIAAHNVTVATVAPPPKELQGEAIEQWKWETVQRWAHKIATQPAGSVRRYSPTAGSRWTKRRRFL